MAMKRLVFLFVLAWLTFGASAQDEERLLLAGVYQGSDLYVQNPFSGAGVSFCVFEVRINGEVTSDEVNSSAFVIDMEVMGLSLGDSVNIVIRHKGGCQPRVLNPEALDPRSTFETEEISVSGDHVLTWKTKGEAGALPFIVEQFRWNKWVKAGEVMGAGKPQLQTYTFQLLPHSGLNRVRVRQVDSRDEERTSPIVDFSGPEQPVAFSPEKPRDALSFTKETRYEIFDEYGNLVKKGFGSSVDLSELDRGEYYVNYDSRFGETFKKR